MDNLEQRKNDFHQLYDFENDPGVTLAHLVRAAGDFLCEIVGRKHADPAMKIALGPLDLGGEAEDGWRDLLEENESMAFSEWPMGHLLHDLSAFAQYGIDIAAEPGEDATVIEARLAEKVETAENFLKRCPMDEWLGSDRAEQLEKTVAMARCRLSLDRSKPVDPLDLAELGNISKSRMRGLISGKTPHLKRENGLVPPEVALTWLEKRKGDGYLASIWREPQTPAGETEMETPTSRIVPRAKDGSIFHPGLKTENGFRIGPKGNELTVETFDEALAELRDMEVAFWRRPSATSGKPGIVREEDWVRISSADFASQT
ncbi:hypothetical protein [Sinisalibacter lacisalsi]|uniref:Uncharacterized protein n=1 Tax=Sinisalibacter lacisalsi TaxID=1526570 RepID=A0ABQ1QAG6_9RHOB|nr:hypothetical protein [Sinisalibacter lacisalsi]GGD19474.1 hypothetical protein GCM10011358_00070 [Sinisalibacter lacisalsi]